MQAIDTIIKRMAAGADAPALFWNDREYSYADFMELVDLWRERLESLHIGKGVVCGFFGEYSPMVCALIFALDADQGDSGAIYCGNRQGVA